MKCEDDKIVTMEEDKIIQQEEWDDLVTYKNEWDNLEAKKCNITARQTNRQGSLL